MRYAKLLVFIAVFLFNVNMYAAEAQGAARSIVLTDEEGAYLRESGQVGMCVNPDWYPYEQIDDHGEHAGIAADLIKEIVSLTGIRIQLVPTKTREETMSYSKAGKCDMVSLLNETEERSEWLLFTRPYLRDPSILVTRADHDYVSDLSRLSGETAVLPQGTSIEERMRRDYPNVRIVIVASEAEAVEAVSAGKADFTVRSQTMAAYTIRKDGLFNLKIAGHIPEYMNKLSIGVSKDKPMLVQVLNKAIGELTQQDEQRAINNHIAVQVVKKFDYRLLFVILGVFAVVVTAGFFWIYQLGVLNKKLKFQKSELLAVGNRLAKSEALYKSFLNASPDAVIIFDADVRIVVASPMAFSLLGLDSATESLNGRRVSDFIAAQDSRRLKANIALLLRGRSIGATEYTGIRKDGRSIIMEVTSEVVPSRDGVPPQVVSVIRDVTERRRMEDDLRRREAELRSLTEELERQNLLLNEQATLDKLTGIPNRYYFDQRIQEELHASDGHGSPVSILLFDLDRFKYVNDTYGHDNGDRVLIRISERVQGLKRPGDVFARWGGEEFVVLMPQTDIGEAAGVAEAIRSVVADIAHPEVGTVTISVGVAERLRGEAPEGWFKRADRELYRAKNEGRNRVCVAAGGESGSGMGGH